MTIAFPKTDLVLPTPTVANRVRFNAAGTGPPSIGATLAGGQATQVLDDTGLSQYSYNVFRGNGTNTIARSFITGSFSGGLTFNVGTTNSFDNYNAAVVARQPSAVPTDIEVDDET